MSIFLNEKKRNVKNDGLSIAYYLEISGTQLDTTQLEQEQILVQCSHLFSWQYGFVRSYSNGKLNRFR